MRYIIQSQITGRFLAPSITGGEPVWVRSLREAGGGVLTDIEQIAQLVIDNTDPDDRAVIIDLDRLGTANDYPI
jgi:hypothetical protein